MSKKLLSTSEVARILGISREAVLKKITSGKLHAKKIGRNFAIAVLSQNKDKDTIARIKDGLEAAEKHACGVKRPFYIMNTMDDEIVVVE